MGNIQVKVLVRSSISVYTHFKQTRTGLEFSVVHKEPPASFLNSSPWKDT